MILLPLCRLSLTDIALNGVPRTGLQVGWVVISGLLYLLSAHWLA